jgi:hypothetical protein
MILFSPTACIKPISKTGQAWNLSQMEGKLTDMENYQPGYIVMNGEEGNNGGGDHTGFG